MTVWERIRAAVGALRRGEPLTAVFDRMRAEPEKTAAFTIAVIALGAKMAKADGRVTPDEVAAFRSIFRIPKRHEVFAARIYNVARTDVAGFDYYARRVARMFRDRPEVLADLLEGLVYIAMADGEYHPHEAVFLNEVARIFGVPEGVFRSIRARHVPGEHDPYAILGAPAGADDATLRQLHRTLVRELHPDRMVARGVPAEARILAEARLASINAAYDAIRREREKVG